MPDLPTAQDATEAALFSEGWDAVLSYADLCTSGSLTAHQLATEAFTLGRRAVRAAASTHVRGACRRDARLPTIPALLTAVRDTAAAWEADGQGHRLDPELRLWLTSGESAFSGPPLCRPVALRGLRDMREADASLLWLAEVEALPLPTIARRLGLAPDTVADELDQARAVFRDCCRRAHLDTPMDAQCRSYAHLLDAVTRSAAVDIPDDLYRHLAGCGRCAEAAACLRLHGGDLPAVLADGVIGWGGLAYLERRRRFAEVRLDEGRPGAADPSPGEEGDGGKVLRRGLLAAAVLLSVLALAVSMMPFGVSGAGTGAVHDDGRPVADPDVPRAAHLSPPADLSVASRVPASPSASVASRVPATPSASVSSSVPANPRTPSAPTTPAATGAPEASGRKGTDRKGRDRTASAPHVQGTSSVPRDARRTSAPAPAAAGACQVTYDLVSQWSDGFQSSVTVTTDQALAGWRVSWRFPDGQQVRLVWDATVRQNGDRVTAIVAGHHRTFAAHATLSFGFVAGLRGGNRPPYAFTLNGKPCGTG
ncbi:cellulose-binding protein [Streptomyces sp. MUSC 125]|uniref:cellulose-binding domain-containing protein n=1 Tax=unclassified Streptomyces TaxID=2593676 RepID=UPI00057CDE1A|nr:MULTISPECIES: cellulose-binding domain-containing protein [unclassified Streptomyces]KIE28747.1 cellulose-binding protein [Streptomyces sp. MUSC 125]MCH0557918.1 cellulose binding domain-containing protein [Streptomyces sp. MUM 16J]